MFLDCFVIVLRLPLDDLVKVSCYVFGLFLDCLEDCLEDSLGYNVMVALS